MACVLTLSELARLVDGDIIRGGHDDALTGMGALDVAGSQDISFLGNDKYRNQFLVTRAGAVIVARGETGGPQTTGLVAVDNPSLAFSEVIRYFSATHGLLVAGIHPRAVVDPSAVFDPQTVRIHAGAVVMAGARLGDGCEIGPNCVIGEQAVLGRNCRIMANVTVGERCILGERVILQPGCVIGSDGFGYAFHDGRHVKIDQVGTVELGDDVEIGANTTIDRARFGKTLVGEGTKIDNLVQIAHNVVLGKHCIIISLTGISGSTRLGNYVTAAGQVGIVGHVTIGDNTILTARTGVNSNVEGGQTYGGKPATPILEQLKLEVLVRRLPKLVERVKALEKAANLQSR
ncbi:MAG: UDP-3-O-(3-hydroxymyristoyl)glucosamine N-acyltransferase [Verrucomicrobiota bacterium]